MPANLLLIMPIRPLVNAALRLVELTHVTFSRKNHLITFGCPFYDGDGLSKNKICSLTTLGRQGAGVQ